MCKSIWTHTYTHKIMQIQVISNKCKHIYIYIYIYICTYQYNTMQSHTNSYKASWIEGSLYGSLRDWQESMENNRNDINGCESIQIQMNQYNPCPGWGQVILGLRGDYTVSTHSCSRSLSRHLLNSHSRFEHICLIHIHIQGAQSHAHILEHSVQSLNFINSSHWGPTWAEAWN